MINSNMRCIETPDVESGLFGAYGLIVTWDVLKH